MLWRFLCEKKMLKEELAENLGISVKELYRLLFRKKASLLIPKINMSLIKLYCKTEFNDNKVTSLHND